MGNRYDHLQRWGVESFLALKANSMRYEHAPQAALGSSLLWDTHRRCNYLELRCFPFQSCGAEVCAEKRTALQLLITAQLVLQGALAPFMDPRLDVVR